MIGTDLHCPYCGYSIDDTPTRVGDAFFHPECAAAYTAAVSGVRCWYDHKQLAGTYNLDAWNNPYCPEHDHQWPRCIYCTRFVDNWRGHGDPAEAHARCDACAKVAVTTNQEASARIGPLWQWMQAQGLTLAYTAVVRASLKNETDIHLESHGAGMTLGVTSYRPIGPGLYDVDVHMCYGMPSPVFECVGVHELGHTWLRLTGVPHDALADREEEGFCEYVAVTWLRAQGDEWATWYAERRARNSDPVYGDGFRHVEALATKVTFGTIIATLRHDHRLPD